MTRPRTGQRKDGREAVASALAGADSAAAAGGSLAGALEGGLAFCTGAALATCCTGAVAGFAAATGAGAGAAAAVAPAGILMRVPGLSIAVVVRRLAEASFDSGTLYCRDNFIRVSPLATVWLWPPATG